MARIVVLTSLLLALLWGAAAWAAWPTGRSLSWVTAASSEFAVVARVDRTGGRPRLLSTPQKVVDTPASLGRLQRALGSAGVVYSLPGRGVSPLQHGARTVSGVDDVTFLGEYFKARELRALYGRLPQRGRADEAVVGFALARRLTPNVRALVGQSVTLGDRQMKLVGVLAPSVRQDEFADADHGVARELMPGELERSTVWRTLPMQFVVVAAPGEREEVRRVTEAFVRRELTQHELVDVAATDRANPAVVGLRDRVEGRTRALMTFALVLGAAGLLTLFAHALAALLRRRTLLGVDRALGATRAWQWRALLFGQLCLALPAAALGTAALWALPAAAPSVFVGTPPLGVQLLALLGPSAALIVLTLLTSAGVLNRSAYEMLRAATPTQRLTWLFALIYLGLALGLTGTLSALTVWSNVTTQADTLERTFTPLWSLETGTNGFDRRRAEAFELQSVTPRLTTADASALRGTPGVEAAAVAQSIGGALRRGDRTVTSPKGMAADAAYFEMLNLKVLEGDTSGCVLNRRLLGALGGRVGDVISVPGVERPVPCRVSGVLAPVDPLYPWLLSDYPEFIAPPLPGLGPSILGPGGRAFYDTRQFRSTRVVLRLTPGTNPGGVRRVFERSHPELIDRSNLIPYAPSASQVLGSLRVQAQLFLLLALLACALCVWGLCAGFFALLDASRFRLAVERACGLSALAAARGWWRQHALLGLTAGAFAGAASGLLAKPMYDAFALDVPSADPYTVLPQAARLLPSAGLMAVTLLALVLLSLVLSWRAHRWLTRQPITTLLKEGV